MSLRVSVNMGLEEKGRPTDLAPEGLMAHRPVFGEDELVQLFLREAVVLQVVGILGEEGQNGTLPRDTAGSRSSMHFLR